MDADIGVVARLEPRSALSVPLVVLLDACLSMLFWFQTSVLAMGTALVPGALLGWLRERTGSVWPCILAHNVADGLPLLASWLA